MDYDKLMDDESAALRKESAQYKDLILVPMKDYYPLATTKAQRGVPLGSAEHGRRVVPKS